MDRLTDYSKKKINKSSKRDSLLKDVTNDVRLDRQNKASYHQRFPRSKKGPKPTIKSIEVSSPKLMGHYTTDIYGKNLVIDGSDGIRVYNLPVERRVIETIKDSNDDVVDNWEQLAEELTTKSKAPPHCVFIPDQLDLDFDLLKGYIPLNEGGNRVSFCGKVRDRTAGMRWLVENRDKFKSETRLFDVDFFAGNGALRTIMTSQFSAYDEIGHIAVVLFKGTFYMFDIDMDDREETELNNRRSFGGLRFEDFVSRGIDGTEHEPSNGAENNYVDAIKYYNLVRFNFDDFKMLITGEIDCVIPGSSAANGKKPKADDFIEIKTSAPLEDKYDPSRMSQMFRCGKVSAWFAQCSLMGMKHIVVGIREEEEECAKMNVRRTHAFTLEELRQSSNGFWSKNRCFNDLKKFLTLIKEKVVEDNPEILNIFEIKCGEVSEPERKIFSDDIDHLPDISEVVELINKL